MKQVARLIPQAERVRSHDHPEEQASFVRAQFNSQMVIVRFCAETADPTEAEYILRNLLQTVAFLERRHDLKSAK